MNITESQCCLGRQFGDSCRADNWGHLQKQTSPDPAESCGPWSEPRQLRSVGSQPHAFHPQIPQLLPFRRIRGGPDACHTVELSDFAPCSDAHWGRDPNVDSGGDEFEKLAPLQADIVGCWYLLHQLSRLSVVHRHEIIGGRGSRIDLDRLHQTTEVIGQAFVERCLGPVYAKVPISWSRIERGILLEDSAMNTLL
jgi:hypothetical protein